MPEGDDLDRMLDTALSSYAEPAPGFENRLLRSMTLVRPRRRWRAWAIGVPLAACLLLMAAVYFLPGRRPQRMAVERAHQTPMQAVPAEAGGLQPTIHAVARRQRRRRERSVLREASTVAVPKLDVFPSPQPLTAEERTLMAGAGKGSEAQRQKLLAASRVPADAPLTIASLYVAPIGVADESKK